MPNNAGLVLSCSCYDTGLSNTWWRLNIATICEHYSHSVVFLFQRNLRTNLMTAVMPVSDTSTSKPLQYKWKQVSYYVNRSHSWFACYKQLQIIHRLYYKFEYSLKDHLLKFYILVRKTTLYVQLSRSPPSEKTWPAAALWCSDGESALEGRGSAAWVYARRIVCIYALSPPLPILIMHYQIHLLLWLINCFML